MEGEPPLRAAVAVFAITCFLAFCISMRFIQKFFFGRKRNRSCYLNSESKPQNTFKRVLADNSYSQFKHLKCKTEKSVPDDDCTNLHPYKGDISKLLKTTNAEVVECLCCDDYDLEDFKMGSSYVWVESEADLRKLAEVLSKERVFSVDTEQHSFRSFLGFTALIQISTKINDYLVDAISLHDMMGVLRPVFADPKICKVFHGADNDVLWLQRDFHIYVVNLFDTAKACDVLSKPQRSLAYLLDTYCKVSSNKLLQREDWRKRPLSEEMIQYARSDAHYLLYIAHCLCLELKQLRYESSLPGGEAHFLLEASRRSNATCLQLFSKDIEACPGELSASSIISRCLNEQGNVSSTLCTTKFQKIVGLLCTWRDLMARLHDESLRFVLSENAISALAANIPTTGTEICNTISKADRDFEFTTLNPLKSPSPVVWYHLEDLIFCLGDGVPDAESTVHKFVQPHLGPGGSCPRSAYNFSLLSNSGLKRASRSSSSYSRFKVSKQVAKKASREMFVQKFSCKSPVYHNCKIYANDGRLLCYCDRRKLEWYVSRNLAKLVENDPPSIMLLFEPKGRPEDEDNDFYIQSKKNICVGCGEANHYLRYRIIPSCYRIHFPEHLKSHRSHDIVLVCVDCHEIAHAAAEKYKRQIATEFGIPLFVRKVIDFDKQNETTSSLTTESCMKVGVSPLELRAAAMALLRHGKQMPSHRRDELMQIIMNYYGRREISDEDLERALMVGMSPHGRRKFGKKKGFTFKHPPKCVNLSDRDDFNVNGKVSASIQTMSEDEISNLFEASTGLTDQTQDGDISMLEDSKASIKVSSLPSGGNGTSYSDSKEFQGSVRESPLKNETKLSLLGHGPHGKQVVEYLLKEQGVNGVQEFCQRWRQVFVEALHPRFLPAGWDVMHSGKRDFGDFSVYNPAKKPPSALSPTGQN